MSGCTIFSHFSDLKKVYDRLVEIHGEEPITLEGSPADWTKLTIKRRKFLRNSTLTLNVMHHEGPGSELEDMIGKMYHVFQSVNSENKEIQQKLLIKIQTLTMAIGMVTDRRLDDWEESIFGTAKALDALVFWNGKQMLNAKGHVILDFDGRVRVRELNVEVSADVLDAGLPQSEEGQTRKKQNEEALKALKIPLNLNLPVIDDTATAQMRTASEIADRALALCLVARKGEGVDESILQQVEKGFDIELPLLSPNEITFRFDNDPDQQSRANFAWRYESLAVLLWALNYLPELPFPDAICDVQTVVGAIREAGSRAGLHAGARLRDPSEILDQADLVYRQHWACVDARLRNANPPANMLNGVVYERHYALNWLRGYQGSEWDGVQVDT